MNNRIQLKPGVCHGKPGIVGTRVLVAPLLGAMAAGDSIENIFEDYPNIAPSWLRWNLILSRLALKPTPTRWSLRDLLLDENFPKSARRKATV